MDLFIDEAHTALDIFRFVVFFPCMLPCLLCGIFSEPLYRLLWEVSLKTSTRIIHRCAKAMPAKIERPTNVNIFGLYSDLKGCHFVIKENKKVSIEITYLKRLRWKVFSLGKMFSNDL